MAATSLCVTPSRWTTESLRQRWIGGVVLAPMSGITDPAFRRIAAQHGAAVVVSEMVASGALVAGDVEARLRVEAPGLGPHIVQLAGCERHWMAEAARMAEGQGAHAIDLNMGCPARRVTGGWSGSALMRDLGHALSLIEATVAAVRVPVSVKMRLGWDDTSLNAPDLARRAEEAGVAWLTVHARTRSQFYKGVARWERVRDVVEATRLPVIVNGDIVDSASARAALARSGAAAVMVGRGAVGRPWWLGELAAELGGRPRPALSASAKAAAARGHVEALLRRMGAGPGLRHARKHVAAYLDEAAGHGGGLSPHERRVALTSEEPAEVLRALDRAFMPQAFEARAA